jgi:hypothetical protein
MHPGRNIKLFTGLHFRSQMAGNYENKAVNLETKCWGVPGQEHPKRKNLGFGELN